jgi:Spy/CpxP family protein refolding chaperone
MKKQTLFLIAISVSFAGNIFLASLFIGKEIGKSESFRERPIKMVLEHVQSLPHDQRKVAIALIKNKKPELRDGMMAARDTRKAIFNYIKSPDYNRIEAEKRLTALRQKTSEVQIKAQTLMLDLADQLTPEQRAEFLKGRNGFAE